MLFDPRILEQATRVGLGTIGETGAVEGTQFGRGIRRREIGLDPMPRIYYPGQAELLQDIGKVRATQDPKLLQGAIQGVLDAPFEETFGFTRTPLGATVEPFFKVKVSPDLPFSQSSIFPILNDPKETEDMYKRFISYAESKKYSATAKEIQKGYLDLRRFNKDMSVLMELGLARGAQPYGPTFASAFKHSLLLYSAAIPPGSATLGYMIKDPRLQTTVGEPRPYRGPRGEGVLARDTQLMKRFAELGILKAKGRQAGGPLTADAIRMFQTVLGPSVGLRMGRGLNEVPLTPTVPGENPMIDRARAAATKDIRAQSSAELRGLVTPEVAQLDPQAKYDRVVTVLKSRLSPSEFNNVMIDAAGGRPLSEATQVLNNLDPETRTRALMRSVGAAKGQDAVVQTLEEAASTSAARAKKKVKPTQTRLTTQSLEAGVLTREEAVKQGNKIARQMKPIVGAMKNPALVFTLAAILSAGMMSAMEEGA